MANLWGEFAKDEKYDNGNRDHFPSEIVKYFVMQAMKNDPFCLHPPKLYDVCGASSGLPSSSDGLATNYDSSDIKLDTTDDTLGLEMDDRVLHSLKLMHHIRGMQELIRTAEEQAALLTESQMQSLPLALDIPQHPIAAPKIESNTFADEQYSAFAAGRKVSMPPITRTTTKILLSKSVAALMCHAGFDTANESVVLTLADATESFISNMIALLRVAVDQGANAALTGFPDAMERVYSEMGIGSVLDIHNYYQENVIRRRLKLLEQCRQLNLEYSSFALQVKPDAMHLDTIAKLDEPDSVPEIHFPALGEDGVDELQPSLEPGFQMLHSLEQEVHLQQLDSQEDSPATDANDASQSSRKRKRIL